MDDNLYSQIRQAIKDRNTWEGRMSEFYRIRFTGIRRFKKPYPGAPDVHYPLVDSDIEKLKPFYSQQLYSDSVLATFTCEDFGLDDGQVAALEQWFDYQLKQRSNLEDAILKGVDYMLTYGFCPVKVYWDFGRKCLAYSPVDPLYAIVPQWTEEDRPDFIVHAMRMSKTQYKANDKFEQSQGFIDSISGSGSQGSDDFSTRRDQDKAEREGLTYSSDKDTIIIWEVYDCQDPQKIMVETISPCLPASGQPVREPFGLPYPSIDGEQQMPFVVLRYDSGQTGWYSSRGIPELVGEHEMSLNKMWNSKLQWLDFFGHPTYDNNSMSPVNPGNFQAAPGRILPQGITKSASESPPPDFMEEMQFIRALAEDRIAIPDIGTSESLAGGNQKGGKTATAVNAIMALGNQSNDLRSRMFRAQMSHIYKQSWSILKAFAGDQINYIFDNQSQQIDASLLQHKYTITPSGSADSWNKTARTQKALAIYQTFSQNPYIKLGELTKWVFEQDDPTLVDRLIQDPQDQKQTQAQQQANEIVLMSTVGFQPTVTPPNDDATHIDEMLQYGMTQAQQGTPPPPALQQRLFKHAGDHLAQMQQKKSPQFGQYAKKVNQAQKLAAMSMQQQPQAPMGMPNVPAQAPAQPPKQDTPAQKAQALAAMAKSGIQINVADANAALAGMGFPPLATSVAPTAQHLNTAKAIAGPTTKPQPQKIKPPAANPIQ